MTTGRLAPFTLPLRREGDAAIVDKNGKTVLVIDPDRDLEDDEATRIANHVFNRLSAAPAPEGGAVKDWDAIRAHPCYGEHQPGCGCTAIATREEAPAQAGEIGAEYDAAAHCVTLAECPPGLFLWNGTLGFKSEYGAMEPDDATNGKYWKVGNRVDAYCADSGEYFWGGTTNHDDRAKLLVYPITAETVAMVASHGPSALRAQPPAREDGGDRPIEASWTDGVTHAYVNLSAALSAERQAWRQKLGLRIASVRYLDVEVPPAREDAQPVGLTAAQLADAIDWFWNAALGASRERQTETAADVASVMVSGMAAIAQGLRETATHPAPDALRAAEEALEAIKEVSGDRAASGYNETGRLARINERCDQALAALQQDALSAAPGEAGE